VCEFFRSKSNHSATHGVTHGTRLAGPRSAKHASLALRHVGFHPPRDGVMERHRRVFGVLDGVTEKSSLG